MLSLQRSIFMACVCLKFEKFIEIQIENSIPLCQWLCRMTGYFFPIEETMSASPSAKYLHDMDQNILLLEQIQANQMSTCESIIEDTILPIYHLTQNWKDGGLCQNCAYQYSLLHFDSCLSIFEKLADGDIPQERQNKRIRQTISIFLNQLEEFKNHYNCVDIIVIE